MIGHEYQEKLCEINVNKKENLFGFLEIIMKYGN